MKSAGLKTILSSFLVIKKKVNGNKVQDNLKGFETEQKTSKCVSLWSAK